MSQAAVAIEPEVSPEPTPELRRAAAVGELTGRLFSGLLDPAARGRFSELRALPGSGLIRVVGPDGRTYEAVIREVACGTTP